MKDLTPEQFEEKVYSKLAEESAGEPREGFGDWIKPVVDALLKAIVDLGPAISGLTPNPLDDIAVDLAVKLIKNLKQKGVITIAPQPE